MFCHNTLGQPEHILQLQKQKFIWEAKWLFSICFSWEESGSAHWCHGPQVLWEQIVPWEEAPDMCSAFASWEFSPTGQLTLWLFWLNMGFPGSNFHPHFGRSLILWMRLCAPWSLVDGLLCLYAHPRVCLLFISHPGAFSSLTWLETGEGMVMGAQNDISPLTWGAVIMSHSIALCLSFSNGSTLTSDFPWPFVSTGKSTFDMRGGDGD